MTRSFCAQDTDGSAHRHTCCERKQDPSTLRFIPKGLLNLNNMEFIWITYGYGPFGSLMSTTSYHKFFQTPPAVTSQKKKQIWISLPQRVHRLPRVQLTCCHSNGCCRTRGWRSNTTGQTGPRIFISTITAIAWDCSLNETMGDMFFVFREGRRQQNLTTDWFSWFSTHMNCRYSRWYM